MFKQWNAEKDAQNSLGKQAFSLLFYCVLFIDLLSIDFKHRQVDACDAPTNRLNSPNVLILTIATKM